MKTTHLITALSTTIVGVVLPLSAAPAHAGSDDVRRSGSCSSGTHWKIKAKPDDGRLEVEAEIDSNRNGQTWRWRLSHDGSAAGHGTSTTKKPSGSFSVERRVDNHAGTDHLRFRAVQPGSGEVCVARLSL